MWMHLIVRQWLVQTVDRQMHVFFVAKPAPVFHGIILAILPSRRPMLSIDWRVGTQVSVVAILATMPTGRNEPSRRIAQVVTL